MYALEQDCDLGRGRAVPEPSGYGKCFGCSRHNPIGMRLAFTDCAGGVQAAVLLGADFESYPGVIHGGIVATVLDEAMARAALGIHRRPATTVGMRVRYARPMETGQAYVVTATADPAAVADGLIRVQGRLEAAGGGLVAIADGTFMLWTAERIATSKSALPTAAAKSLEQFINDMDMR